MDPEKRTLRNLTPQDLARVLSQAGAGEVSEEEIVAALEHDAPRNSDGTIHLVLFGAWLNQQLADRT